MFEAMNWEESKAYCSAFSAQLFDALDGTEEQLLLLAQHMQGQPYWLGITDDVTEGLWLDSQGQNVDELINWREPVDPSGRPQRNWLCMLHDPWTAFDDCLQSGGTDATTSVYPLCHK